MFSSLISHVRWVRLRTSANGGTKCSRDNGSKFAELSLLENGKLKVYFTLPCSSWEKGTNECHNRMLRSFIPTGKSISNLRLLQIATAIYECSSDNYTTHNTLYHKYGQSGVMSILILQEKLRNLPTESEGLFRRAAPSCGAMRLPLASQSPAHDFCGNHTPPTGEKSCHVFWNRPVMPFACFWRFPA